ncbi:MAG: hypothetical protein JST12_12375 [Armatimonadetes bacterium]|nr:hypothetical protein [Armatimonadota bacterium]MBS1702452.1 hypothetical protein [Armatimonadota bacterium]MBS1725880.1 hypothetical protein [Armatimonadota bacterium]
MKTNALWFAAVAAGVAAVAYKFVTNKNKTALGHPDSAQTWISNAEERLRRINLKLHSNDSVA